MDLIVLGLGSNKSFGGFSSVEILQKAVERLSDFVSEMKVSSVYKTKPMYVEEQSKFFNMAVCGFVHEITPEMLLEKIHCIEAEFGRNRDEEIRNGPRSLDIDIELFGESEVNEKNLQIPHPRISERAFVLIPVLEIFPKNADEERREFFEKSLENLGDDALQQVEKFLDSCDFLKEVRL